MAWRPKLITFDAHGTLLDFHFEPGEFAVRCAVAARLQVPAEAAKKYLDVLYPRWPQYLEINLKRSPEAGDAFWIEVTAAWLKDLGQKPTQAFELMEIAQRKMFEEFECGGMFPDVLPMLDLLDEYDIRLAVLSNWDYSLHRMIAALKLTDRFDRVFASLEEGPEKPDPTLFRIVLDHFGVKADDALHVGDNVVDDIEGAKGAGMRATLIDRSSSLSNEDCISTLVQIPKVLGWM